MSDEVIDTTNDYLKAAEAADDIDFFKQFGLDNVTEMHRKIRQSYIHGYMAALASLRRSASQD